jgi:hypothetical protein
MTLQIFKEQVVYCTRSENLVNHYVVLKQQTKNPDFLGSGSCVWNLFI